MADERLETIRCGHARMVTRWAGARHAARDARMSAAAAHRAAHEPRESGEP